MTYYPATQLKIDETMVEYKGKTKYKQYGPVKPTKWGIKCWTLAESISGYLLDLIIYKGKNGELSTSTPKCEAFV